MKYKSLKAIYYSDRDNYENEYKIRLNSYGTIHTKMFPYLMKKEEFASSTFPLFSLPLVEIQYLSQLIIDHSQKIKQIASLLPEVAHQQFYNDQIFNAIISTNEIEGIGTTRKDIAAAIDALNKNTKRKFKHRSTVRMYLDILSENHLHITEFSHIKELYEGLTDGEIDVEDKVDGKYFRKEDASVLNKQTGKILHIAPNNEEKIQEMVQTWLDFINTSNIPFLIKASLGHFFFENIHPFYDGNGRTGRYILSKYLSRKLDKFSGLIVSKKINEDKNKYYKAFLETGNIINRADGTIFVHTMLSFIIEGQIEIIDTLSEKLEILEYYSNKLEKENFTNVEKNIIYLLLQSQLFVTDFESSITDIEILKLLEHTEHSQRSIKRSLNDLENSGLIYKVSKRPIKHLIKDDYFDYKK